MHPTLADTALNSLSKYSQKDQQLILHHIELLAIDILPRNKAYRRK